MAQTNRLIDEHSPYLIQHAENPVNWYPWCDEAFERARQDDKPIFLSIGYSTCHWCHVMAHESFEDGQIARLMNDAFVCIKVDREERPDIDDVYMRVCQLMTGGGGWPLTIIMTPDKKPFFAGTYIPKDSRFGRTGMRALVPHIAKLWREERETIDNAVGEIGTALSQLTAPGTAEDVGEQILTTAYNGLAGQYDDENGGFGIAPKFPMVPALLFLLRQWKRTGDREALRMVTTTLDALRRGGIYDHVGFGFHRYATDAAWRVPHFEKMLYDQALLLLAYTEAYQATGAPLYKQTAQEIITYVLRDMTDACGGFYSGEDADSEGEEGLFYLWDEEEFRTTLGDDAAFARAVFSIAADGNYADEATGKKTGQNILYQTVPRETLARNHGMSTGEFAETLEAIRETLFTRREACIRPAKDDKILTDWNGLMIAALARAGFVFDDARAVDAAKKACDFILTTMYRDGRLLHRFRAGDAAIAGYLDDYAHVIFGLIELYQATGGAAYLEHALSLTETMQKHFWDGEHGGFFMTADDGEHVLIRQKETHDGALVSGNSSAFVDLIRLARLTGRSDFEEQAAALLRAFGAALNETPSAHAFLLTGLEFVFGDAHEVVLAGDDISTLLAPLRTAFIPDMVLLRRDDALAAIAPFTAEQHAINGAPTAYVCTRQACSAPTTDPDAMMARLGFDEK